MTGERTDEGRAFVLGLDGVPWDLLTEWTKAGKLPNFARLYEDGATGPLESTMPPTTALAWPSIATGVRPDKHGVYSFRGVDESYTHRLNTRRDVASPELWDLLSPAVVGNVPMTYPAEAIDGEMVAGMLTPDLTEGFTHPPELGERFLEDHPDYETGLEWSEYTDRPEAFVTDLAHMVEGHRSLMTRLMDRRDWQVFFFVYTSPDRLQHLVWDEEVLLEHYTEIDAILGDVLSYVMDLNATLFVVSDHGFGPVSTLVSLNAALERGGFLARQGTSGTRGALGELGVTKDSILAGLNRIGVDRETIVDHLPETVVERVASAVPGDHVLYDVDYSQTTAFVHGPGNCYINSTDRFERGIVDPRDVPRVKEQVTELFEDLTDPATGERPVSVFDGDTLFPTDDASPDLVVRAMGEYHKATDLNEEVFRPSGNTVAAHRRDGVALAWGPDVAAGTRLDGATVFDVAPTVLHAVGEPVPDHVDGTVLDCFDPDSPTAKRSVETYDYGETTVESTDGDEDFGNVEDRLRGLGYME